MVQATQALPKSPPMVCAVLSGLSRLLTSPVGLRSLFSQYPPRFCEYTFEMPSQKGKMHCVGKRATQAALLLVPMRWKFLQELTAQLYLLANTHNSQWIITQVPGSIHAQVTS